jgi:FAD/FMN-containing dehydrogenase
VAVGVLAVWAGTAGPPDALVDAIGDRDHAVLGGSAAALARAWAPRERQAEAIARRGVPHKLDVTLPLAELAAFTAALPGVVTPWTAVVFGHLGDGNLHVNVLGPDPGDDAVDDAVLALVARFGGSISAEHGIGRAKARWLHLSRRAEEIAAFTAIRRALDPAGVMNPGVLLAEGDGYGPAHADA